MVAGKIEYKYLSIVAMNSKYGTHYQAKLSKRIDSARSTIGLGKDHLQALNLALLIDEAVHAFVTAGQPIDLDSLKQKVSEAKNEAIAKKTGLQIVRKDSLLALWENYASFHRAIPDHWEESYYLTHIQTCTNLIKDCPYQKLEEKDEIVRWLFDSKSRTAKTSKARLKLIVAAIDWNSKRGNIPRRWGIEYRDLLSSISIKSEKKSSFSEEDEADIFSVKEVYSILDALKNDTYSRFDGKHSQYYKYAYFCWLTGCRPSEAVALKWENVDLVKKRIKFCEGQLSVNGKTVKKRGTKTVEFRFFPINNELEELLLSIPHRTGHVFVNQRYKPISQPAFTGVWKGLLEAMGIRYRIPYQLRHTMISYHANNDFNISKLAEIVGNSEEVIRNHYLRLDIERISLPDVIK